MNPLTLRIVKRLAVLSLAVGSVGFNSFAKAGEGSSDYVNVAVPAANSYQQRSIDDLKQLTASVALYPDAMLAQVFVASTYPNDVVAAAQYLQNGGDPAQVSEYGWDASVQGLMQTPDVLNLLANNVDWMNQLGDAFLNQQQDLFTSVQFLRSQAQDAGNLVSTDQAQVVVSDNIVQIIPRDPQIIYVPRYDPEIVYVRRHVEEYEPCITFSVGVQVGLWLHDDFDWCDHRVYVGDWGGERPWWNHDHEHDRGDYRHERPGTYVNINNVSNVTNVTNVTDIKNVTVNNYSSEWKRNSEKPAPRHIDGAIVQRPVTISPNLVASTVGRRDASVNHSPANPVLPTRPIGAPTVSPAAHVTASRTVAVAPRPVAPVKPLVDSTRHVSGPTHPTQPTQPVKPAVGPANPANLPVHPVAPVRTAAAQPTPPVSLPAHPVQPAKPAIIPMRPVALPTHPVQPAKPIFVQPRPVQPARTVTQPVTHVVQPTRPVAQPVRPVAQPARPIAQPVRPVAQPARLVAQPVRTVTQPVRTVAQPARPVAQPARTVAQPSRPVAQPRPVSQPAVRTAPAVTHSSPSIPQTPQYSAASTSGKNDGRSDSAKHR